MKILGSLDLGPEQVACHRSAHRSAYPETGWVGVLFGNSDDLPFPESLERKTHATIREPIDASGGGN